MPAAYAPRCRALYGFFRYYATLMRAYMRDGVFQAQHMPLLLIYMRHAALLCHCLFTILPRRHCRHAVMPRCHFRRHAMPAPC